MTRHLAWLLLALGAAACLKREVPNPNVIVVSLAVGPNNLDPRLATDDASQKVHQLIFDDLMDLDEHLRVTPKLAERIEHPAPLTYVVTLRRGVRFHDGHELTSADVVFTYGCYARSDLPSRPAREPSRSWRRSVRAIATRSSSP